MPVHGNPLADMTCNIFDVLMLLAELSISTNALAFGDIFVLYTLLYISCSIFNVIMLLAKLFINSFYRLVLSPAQRRLLRLSHFQPSTPHPYYVPPHLL